VDLTALPLEMQHLVIKSSLDWVLAKEESTLVVIPEAWKFTPESRATPVKQAAVALIRQGAALQNYVWMDSQDLGGISKEMLRSVTVWLLGVQREANEIKRTLDNIPAGVAKPTKATIATLALGQFVACWGRHAVPTYAQPSWMPPAQAVQVATGALAAEDAARLRPGPTTPAAWGAAFERTGRTPQEDPTVTEAEAARITRENADLKAQLVALRDELAQLRQPLPTPAPPISAPAPAPWPPGDLPQDRDTETLYQAFKRRLLAEAPEDPVLVKLLATRPEVVVEITPTVITIDDEFSMKGRVVRLIAQGWFAEPRTVGGVRAELKRTGNDPGGGGTLGQHLANLVRDRILVREGEAFLRAPDVVVREQARRAS
jgi:hypothetical protein